MLSICSKQSIDANTAQFTAQPMYLNSLLMIIEMNRLALILTGFQRSAYVPKHSIDDNRSRIGWLWFSWAFSAQPMYLNSLLMIIEVNRSALILMVFHCSAYDVWLHRMLTVSLHHGTRWCLLTVHMASPALHLLTRRRLFYLRAADCSPMYCQVQWRHRHHQWTCLLPCHTQLLLSPRLICCLTLACYISQHPHQLRQLVPSTHCWPVPHPSQRHSRLSTIHCSPLTCWLAMTLWVCYLVHCFSIC